MIDMPIQHLLFDNDGTLVDSEILAVRTMLHLIRSYGLDMTEQEYCAQFPGLKLLDILDILSNKYGLELPRNALEESRAAYVRIFEQELQAVPGMQELFLRLKTPKSVVSNGSILHVERSLKYTKMHHALDGRIFSAEQVERPKPFPDVYRYALQELNLSAESVLVIEDSPVGVQAAKAAGLRVVGFLGATHIQQGHGEILARHGADVIVQNASDLLVQLEKFRIH
ncbi:MAG: HAD family hydrolase [Bacteroidetes bacterium]|nr:MAG: HAD family hydrolase [Bacteroidota bacterium]